MSCVFPNAGGALENTQGSYMMKKCPQRKFKWTELPAFLAEELLRLHGVGVELSESVFFSDDTGTLTPYKLLFVIFEGSRVKIELKSQVIARLASSQPRRCGALPSLPVHRRVLLEGGEPQLSFPPEGSSATQSAGFPPAPPRSTERPRGPFYPFLDLIPANEGEGGGV